jgi:hypothetical protein
MESTYVRLSININSETAAFLQGAKVAEGRSVTEIIRRAVSVYRFVTQTWQDGDQLAVIRQDGTVHQVVQFP